MTSAQLNDLAAAIADGAAIDPTLFESVDPHAGPLAAGVRIVSRVAQFHGVSADGDRSVGDAGGPESWGPLAIVRQLGRGTFADVYLATDPRLNRPVALKLLRAADRSASAVVEEGNRLARIRHANVVTVYGAERIGNRVGVWMEYIDGPTLEAWRGERGPLSSREVIRIGVDLAGALAAVHAAGLIHRDVKADNVIVEATGRVVLTDLGASRDASAGPPHMTELAGTPLYSAPEVLQGQPATAQSDIYSLGVLLYLLTTGSFPVSAESLAELRQAHDDTHRRVPIRRARRDTSRALASIIERAAHRDPARRYQRAEDLQRALLSVHSRRARRIWSSMAATVVLLVAFAARLSWVESLRASDTKPSVLVGPFENLTSDPILNEVIGERLRRELSASDAFSVVTGDRVRDALELMRRPAAAALDRAAAREIAIRDGAINAILTGSIEHQRDRYVLTVDIVDPRDGTIVAKAEDATPAVESMTAVVRRQAQAVAALLIDRLPALPAVPRQTPAVTPSLVAFVRLNESQRLAAIGALAAAQTMAQQAVAADPEFAAGWAWLAWVHRNSRESETGRNAIQRATALAPHTALWERLWIDAVRSALARDYKAAAVSARVALETRPDHTAAAEVLAAALAFLNRRGEQPDVFTRLADARPRDVPANLRAAQSVVAARRDVDGARRYLGRVTALARQQPGGGRSRAAMWVEFFEIYADWRARNLHAAAARLDQMMSRFGASPEVSRSELVHALHSFHLTFGQLDRAHGVLDTIADPLWREGRRTPVLLYESTPDALRAHLLALDNLVRTTSNARNVNNVIPPFGYLRAGLIDEAREAIASFVPAHGPAAYLGRAQHDIARGELAMRDQRPDAAVAIFAAAFDALRDEPNMGDYHRACRGLARALAVTGRTPESVGQLEACSDAEPYLSDSFFFGGAEWLQTRFALAEAYRAVGRRREAGAIDTDLRRLLQFADARHALVTPLRRQ